MKERLQLKKGTKNIETASFKNIILSLTQLFRKSLYKCNLICMLSQDNLSRFFSGV
jgi:hypothetical protein